MPPLSSKKERGDPDVAVVATEDGSGVQRPEVEAECGAESACGVSCSGDKGEPPADSVMGAAGEELSSMRAPLNGEAGVSGMIVADGGRRKGCELTDAAVALKAAGELAREEKAVRLAAASEPVGCMKLVAPMPSLPMDEACQGADGRGTPEHAP